jgi:hypothetical protein
MTSQTPGAYIAHQMPGRVRFRVPSKRGDAAFLARVSEALRVQPGIAAVTADARTGSVLVKHEMGAEDVASLAESKALFRVTDAPDRRPSPAALALMAVRQNPKAAALAVTSFGFAATGTYQLVHRHMTGTTVDSFWKAYGAYRIGQPWASAALIACGLYALTQGRILGPAASLLYYGLRARHMAQTSAQSGSRE